MLRSDKKSGFTLIELSVVLTIISIFLGMILLSTESRIAEAKIYTTKEKMQTILDALDKYVKTYGYLPCPTGIDSISRTDPDYGYGLGSNSGGNCSSTGIINLLTPSTGDDTVYKGAVPFKTLGLDADLAVDGWGNRFTYAVAGKRTYVTGYAFTGNDPFIQVYTDAAGSIPIDNDEIFFTLISNGHNSYGAFLDKDGSRVATGAAASESENSDSDADFISIPVSTSFDDIILYKTRSQLPSYFYSNL